MTAKKTSTLKANPSRWAPYLDPEETILWIGHPKASLGVKTTDIPIFFVRGLFLAAYLSALFIVPGAILLEDGGLDLVPAIATRLFSSVSLYIAAGSLFVTRYLGGAKALVLAGKPVYPFDGGWRSLCLYQSVPQGSNDCGQRDTTGDTRRICQHIQPFPIAIHIGLYQFD
jgi:hypothetical protein